MPQGTLHAYRFKAIAAGGAALAAGLAGATSTGATDHRAASGGAAFVAKPRIKTVRCAAGCASHGRVRNGGTVRVRGQGLSETTKVVFLGGRGRADDVAARVTAASDRTLAVKVPYSAASGPLSAVANRKVHSRPSKPLRIVPAPPPQASPQLTPVPGPAEPGAPRLETALSSGTVFAGAHGVSFSYRVVDGGPASIGVTLVRVADGAVIKTWTAEAVGNGIVQTIAWDAADGADGRYAFRLAARGQSGAVAQNAAVGDTTRDAFDLHGYAFPLRARHSYGDGFGAARGGHSHQGQDVFARCGTPILAARGGKVKDAKFHSAAGNYVVIDGAGTGQDFFYAHLRSPSPLSVGDRVDTGQQVGHVGDTGDASACHLHFEIWSSPGWYS
ncbi:MAG TPA: M23 family metallopeptidase, partial [Thermoleophilaceae bacterium]